MSAAPRERVARITAQIAALEHQLDVLKTERSAFIIEMRRAGVTLGGIGKVTGLTRQRILQIIQKYEGADVAR